MSNKFRLLLVVVIISIGVMSLWYGFHLKRRNLTSNPTPNTSPIPNSTINPSPITHILGTQTKSSHCVAVDGLPDSDCTPGAVIPAATKEQICQNGYAASVRNVPDAEKKLVYQEYGILSHNPGEYEVDHLISLELGGSNDIANLWPEAASPEPGYHQKDQVENYLHHQVCDGTINLSAAQHQIATNWKTFYQQFPR